MKSFIESAKIIQAVALCLSLGFANAALGQVVPNGYHCDVSVIAPDAPEGGMIQKFDAPFKSQGSHGGDVRTFQFGPYQVQILADGFWRSLSWWKGQTMVAETVTAAAAPILQHSVVIVYNPSSREDQAYLSCMPF